jgi:ubiquinone/menaquinone biosynthesis C-methylase UbiE
MEMTGFEKYFVNRDAKVRRNIEAVRECLSMLEVDRIRNVLELGCGIGGVSAFLADEYGLDVVGTDYDLEQIAIAKEKYPETENLRFRSEDASRLSFDDGSFDLVLAQDVFHHIAAWEAAVAEVGRVLRPGGYLMWMDFAYPKIVKGAFRPFVKHYGLYTWADVLGTFAKVGLEPDRVERLKHGPFSYRRAVVEKSDRKAA